MHTALDRRTFLRATGIGLALPLLESMSPALAFDAVKPPRRMVFICTTLGLHPQSLWPKTPGMDFESTEYLSLLKEHRAKFTLFSGMAHEAQSGRQPHNSEMTWLTAARGPGLDGFRNTISIDQYAAAKLGSVTRFPSVTLGSNSPQSQSFTSSGVMVPAETSPARLFAQLFLQGKPAEVEDQKRRLREGRSILDQLQGQTKQIRQRASSGDHRQLDEYFESVRKAEQEIAAADGWLNKPKPKVDAKQPEDVRDNRNLSGRVQLLVNLIPLILQTDSSRVVTVMIQDHQAVPQIAGVSGEHHNLSHHGFDKAKLEQLKKIESELVRGFGRLLTNMTAKAEAGGTLLDHTAVLFGSNLGNANSHDTKDLPTILAGGGFKHRGFVANKPDKSTPLCNLYLTMLNSMGMETKAFAQSTGEVSL
ncbi:DUF1552 domain-containing protein [soil metagenome]